MNDRNQLLRHLPAVDRILNEPALIRLSASCPRVLILESVQEAVAELRREILEAPQGTPDLSPAAIAEEAARRAGCKLSPSLQPVLNATGTLLHTNLGRAPLCDSALLAMQSVACGYSNLEFDLASGERGHRYAHVEALLCRLTGAEAATVVNNNAGAVLLALTALACGKEAIVSRGELVEIGGAFRVPDVMAAGGVALREVGTTNKTHLKDYREAIGTETALFLKVHTSNYRIVGFTAAVSAADLVALAHEHGLMVMEDLGSGMLIDLSPFGLPREPTVREAVESGIDIVTFSGDKLLGGPQGGVILGKHEAVEKIRRHPMARAMRIDKLTLAALEATLRHYLDPQEALREIPVLQMLAASSDEIRQRCRRLCRKLSRILADEASVEIVAEPSKVGGGALPLTELPGFALALSPKKITAQTLAARLRRGRPPVVGRLHEDHLLLNPRTLAPREEGALIEALGAALSQRNDPTF